MKRRKWAALALTMSIPVGAGCGSAGDDPPPASSSPPNAPTSLAGGTTATQTIPVQVGGNVEGVSGVLAAFGPKSVSAHTGDTIEFQMSASNSEPHTVALGTLVEDGLTTAEGALKLPDVFPQEIADQPLLANQSAAQPCFLDTGLPPLARSGGAPACERRTPRDFTGREAFYSSGVLAPGERFEVRIAPNARPGTYQFTCLVHRGRMTGSLTVVHADVPVLSASDVDAKGRQDIAGLAAVAAAGRERASAPGHVLAGVILPNLPNAFLAEFVPSRLSLAVGQSVAFDAVATHSIAFNAVEDDVGPLRLHPDGLVTLNARAFAPVGSRSPPPPYSVFHSWQTSNVFVDGGSFDGRGFKSSGLLSVLPPGTVSYKVTFTMPGTYEVRCLVHRDMKAQVTVS